MQWIEARAQEPGVFEGIPAEHGYYFPAEWEPHEATWLSWPHNRETWPGKFESIWPAYLEFIRVLSLSEQVKINVKNFVMAKFAFEKISNYGAELENIFFYENPTNDAWCRDHGPAFLANRNPSKPKLIVDWEYNAWGGKYPPFDLDNRVPSRIGAQLAVQVARPGIVMEGGSVDFNGAGALLTSEACLLNPNRNPHLGREEIEQNLRDYYGVVDILWVKEGIAGDDTDGHIDDTARFVNKDTVIVMVEADSSDENHAPLRENRDLLKRMGLHVIELQMPEPLHYRAQRLPASYANFYLSNGHVIVPVFNSKYDGIACSILQECFPGRQVTGIDARDLVWGLGAFHCLSQQEVAG